MENNITGCFHPKISYVYDTTYRFSLKCDICNEIIPYPNYISSLKEQTKLFYENPNDFCPISTIPTETWSLAYKVVPSELICDTCEKPGSVEGKKCERGKSPTVIGCWGHIIKNPALEEEKENV